jgi:two-component system OmpR family sensor kinase
LIARVARISLRARLVLGVILVAAAGLAAADVATYTLLRSSLLERAERSLDTSAASIERSLFAVRDGRGHDGPLPDADSADFVEVRSTDGLVLYSSLSPRLSGASPPRLPGSLELAADGGPSHLTVPAEHGASRYLVRVSLGPDASTMTVVGTSLSDVDGTLQRLLLIELLVTGLVLAGIAGLGLWVVRLGLRPLDAIETTAAAIARGDLSRRVERAEDRTEVGRLGLALNAMLGQIETAFRAQEASERTLRRFVADASHELRTPLAAVRAYAELFTRGAAERPDDLARSMKGISRESQRMSLLVEDLLLLARLDEGRPLERDPIQLDGVVAEAVETALTVEPDRRIELEAERAVVVGDRARLRQVVDNLLANVRAHTPPGTPVRVRLSRRNGSAEIAVADNGPGMDAHHVAHVFERFYRADPSRARASGGVGLGLSIVAAVAEAHGGTASATSQPGRGSTFRIELPLRSHEGNERHA